MGLIRGISGLIQLVPFFRSKQSFRVIPWFKDNGDNTHRLNYALNHQSIVFDLGGYKGQWASDIFSKYCCSVYIFEPYIDYFKKIDERFSVNDKIKVFDFGLSDVSKTANLLVSGDSSSLYKEGETGVMIDLMRAIDFLNENEFKKIDLMKINIEGGEYDLLEHLIEEGAIQMIDNIQVQFHDFVSNSETRMRRIQSELMKTHFLTYQYEFVWENWKLK